MGSAKSKYHSVAAHEEQHLPSEDFKRKYSIFQVVLWLEFANIVLFGLLFALSRSHDTLWAHGSIISGTPSGACRLT
jgi:hypothetical protein